MIDLIFLKALREKLKGGNARSVHLNALPGRFATRLDVAHLNYIEPGLSDTFLKTLLSRSSFEFKLSFDKMDMNLKTAEEQKNLTLLSKRLNALYIENEDNFKEHGIKTFGFGYPLIIKRSKQDSTKFIKAPLLIWPLEIIKSYNKVNTWSLLRNQLRNEDGRITEQDVHPAGLNEVLISFIKTDENISLARINEDILEDALIDENELLKICITVLQSLNADTGTSLSESLAAKAKQPLATLPEPADLETITGNIPWIHFGGVFGLFRTQKESIISDIDTIIQRYDEFEFDHLTVDPFTGTTFSVIDTDPSQQEILNTLSLDPRKIIQGPPGTGKSQSLTALITNALTNNLKCLVVCEKKTALDVIKNNLHRENEQLGALATIIEDISKDRDGIVNAVRDRLGSPGSTPYFNHLNYKSTKESVESIATAINEEHRQLDRKIYQGKMWTEIAGEYLRYQKQADGKVLNGLLDFNRFSFSNENNELAETVLMLKRAKPIWNELNALDHPLDILDNSVFQDQNLAGIQLNLEKLVAGFNLLFPSTESLIKNYQHFSAAWQTESYPLYPASVRLAIEDWVPRLKGRSLTETAPLPPAFELEARISGYSDNLAVVESDINNILVQYKNWLNAHYTGYHKSLKQAIGEYLAFIDQNISRHGVAFLKNGSFTRFMTNVLSVFSGKHKELKQNRLRVVSDIDMIREVQTRYEYVSHTYISVDAGASDLQLYVNNINELHSHVNNWYGGIQSTIDNYVAGTHSSFLHEEYAGNSPDLLAIEEKFGALRNELVTHLQIGQHEPDIQPLLIILRSVSDLKKELNILLDAIAAFRLTYKSNSDRIGELNQRIKAISDPFAEGNIFKEKIVMPATLTEAEMLLSRMQTELGLIAQHLPGFRTYYNWRVFYDAQSSLHQQVVRAVAASNCTDWENTFTSWYLHWLLSINEHRNLPKDSYKILDFIQSKKELRAIQVKSIISHWNGRQEASVKRVQQIGINAASLFNKRGAKGERRNSLRKIIRTDFELFTDFYPVLMVSPSVCSSILPLTEGLFDIVIFDEASQLRLEDTFSSLLRGKIRIVSGDSQQMPPSSYFQGGGTILNPADEDYDQEEDPDITLPKRNADNALNLADSESLLVYAENSNYKQSYLKVHYRSQHPLLIDFSNHAFYGKRLIPMPPKEAYVPIQYIEVNGVYEEQVNKDEAKKVIDILLHQIRPFSNGKYPSVGIATFNLYQRNLIIEEIGNARQASAENDKKIDDLGPDLFVKNLENIQGDERDIIIISTTFGRKPDGSFKQSFGPIIQRNGYKLLNVIITRAKHKVIVCTSVPAENIKQYTTLLQTQKNNGRAIFYTYLAYAKAVHEENNDQVKAILDLLYENCASKTFEPERDMAGSASSFGEEVSLRLAERIGGGRITQQYKIGGFRIDLIIRSKITGEPLIALECDGAKYHGSNEAYAWDMFRQMQLEQYGLTFFRIWSTNWWHSPEKELEKLIGFIAECDLKERQEDVPAPEML